MADKKPITDAQRAEIKALADKAARAYRELREAVEAIGAGDDFSGSCRMCPRTPGGGICSSFEGTLDGLDAICTRPFCGHPFLAHVG